MKITIDNYYTIDNLFITSSKLKDWGEDKKKFYDKHILHKGCGGFNPAYAYGSLMDYLLSGREDLFNKSKHVLPFGQIKNIERIAKAVKKSKEFKLISSHQTQRILFYPQKIGIFDGFAGIPDYIKTEDGLADIVDLKTTAANCKIDFRYHCIKYKYYFQQAFYQVLIELIDPTINKFNSRLLVIYKRHKEPKFDLIQLDQKLIDKEKIKVWQYINELRAETKFGRYEKTWNL